MLYLLIINQLQNEPSSSKGVKFDQNEKLLLLSYIEDLADIIEDTSTTSKSVKKKNNAWRVITEQFAANSKVFGITTRRTEAQLKNCWRNLKHRFVFSIEKFVICNYLGQHSMPKTCILVFLEYL